MHLQSYKLFGNKVLRSKKICKKESKSLEDKRKTPIFSPEWQETVPCHPKVLRDYFFRIQYTVYSFFRELIIGSWFKEQRHKEVSDYFTNISYYIYNIYIIYIIKNYGQFFQCSWENCILYNCIKKAYCELSKKPTKHLLSVRAFLRVFFAF